MQLLLNAFCDWWTNASGRRCGFWRKLGRIPIPTFWCNWNLLNYGVTGNIYETFLFNGLQNREDILNSILFCKIKPMITTLNLDASLFSKKIRWHRICPRSAAGMAAWWVGPFLKSNEVIGFLSSWRPGTNDSMQPLWQLPESEHLEGFHAHSHDTLP